MRVNIAFVSSRKPGIASCHLSDKRMNYFISVTQQVAKGRDGVGGCTRYKDAINDTIENAEVITSDTAMLMIPDNNGDC